jgi:hypothetical protein
MPTTTNASYHTLELRIASFCKCSWHVHARRHFLYCIRFIMWIESNSKNQPLYSVAKNFQVKWRFCCFTLTTCIAG